MTMTFSALKNLSRDIATVGRVLTQCVDNEAQLALLTCEIGKELSQKSDGFPLSDWHIFMSDLRDAKRAEERAKKRATARK